MKRMAKVLVVDDNEETLETICHMAREICTEVMGVDSYSACMDFMKERDDIDLILCDWNMPDKTGLDLLQELRGQGNLVPFIMVTARSDLNSVLEARKFGVDLYISKPFSTEELKQKIQWVFNNLDRSNLSFSDESITASSQ